MPNLTCVKSFLMVVTAVSLGKGNVVNNSIAGRKWKIAHNNSIYHNPFLIFTKIYLYKLFIRMLIILGRL